MSPDLRQRSEQTIKANKIVIFMKGTPDFPQCGFSAATVDCLNKAGAEFAAIDVLADWEIREAIKEYSSWPTIPQVYIEGEFIGGADITRELFRSGELVERVKKAQG